MGYYTDYSGTVSGFLSEEEEAAFKEDLFKYSDGYGIALKDGKFYAGGIKWYTHQKDLTALSKKYPHILIELEGWGEEKDDRWKKRFFGGGSECVEVQFTFPPFAEITDLKVKQRQDSARQKALPQFIRHKKES